MSQHLPLNASGAAMQSYNNEMVKCIEDLCSKRDELRRQIEADQEEKTKLHNDIRLLTDKYEVGLITDVNFVAYLVSLPMSWQYSICKNYVSDAD